MEFGSFDVGAASSSAVQADGGRIILNGNTFGEGSVHVKINAGVRSAILMGNQAVGGLVVENESGGRTQMIANEPLPAPLPVRALASYRLLVGGENDSRFLRRFHGREAMPPSFGKEGPMRWSTEDSEFRMPVQPGKPYTVTVELVAPEPALHQDAGLYLGGTRIAAIISPGLQTLRATPPPQKENMVRLTLRCRGWSPAELAREGGRDLQTLDARTLGVAVHSITLRAEGASGEPFDANALR